MYNDYYMNILKYIQKSYSANEICKKEGITRKQLYYYLLCLKNDGISFNRKYYDNGEIVYCPIKSIRDYENKNSVDLITEKDKKFVKLLVISDIHFGNDRENIKYLESAYNYCIKNGINVILNAGDLIDGTFTFNEKEREDEEVYEQIRHLIKDYPFDESITNICVLGNHDYSAFKKCKINLEKTLENKRHDIITCGFANTTVNIKNDKILLFHNVNGIPILKDNFSFIFKGHSHKYLTEKKDNTASILVPSLSDVQMHDTLPSCLDLYLEFKDGLIVASEIKQVSFMDKDLILGVNRIDFERGKTQKGEVQNEEDYSIFSNGIFDDLIIDDLDEEKRKTKKLKI